MTRYMSVPVLNPQEIPAGSNLTDPVPSTSQRTSNPGSKRNSQDLSDFKPPEAGKETADSFRNPSRVGWLYKKSDSSWGGWRRRYAVLHNSVLYYYHELSDEKPAGKFVCLGLEVGLIDGKYNGSSVKKNSFFVRHKGLARVYIFAADTLEDARSWVETLVRLSSCVEVPVSNPALAPPSISTPVLVSQASQASTRPPVAPKPVREQQLGMRRSISESFTHTSTFTPAAPVTATAAPIKTIEMRTAPRQSVSASPVDEAARSRPQSATAVAYDGAVNTDAPPVPPRAASLDLAMVDRAVTALIAAMGTGARPVILVQTTASRNADARVVAAMSRDPGRRNTVAMSDGALLRDPQPVRAQSMMFAESPVRLPDEGSPASKKSPRPLPPIMNFGARAQSGPAALGLRAAALDSPASAIEPPPITTTTTTTASTPAVSTPVKAPKPVKTPAVAPTAAPATPATPGTTRTRSSSSSSSNSSSDSESDARSVHVPTMTVTDTTADGAAPRTPRRLSASIPEIDPAPITPRADAHLAAVTPVASRPTTPLADPSDHMPINATPVATSRSTTPPAAGAREGGQETVNEDTDSVDSAAETNALAWLNKILTPAGIKVLALEELRDLISLIKTLELITKEKIGLTNDAGRNGRLLAASLSMHDVSEEGWDIDEIRAGNKRATLSLVQALADTFPV